MRPSEIVREWFEQWSQEVGPAESALIERLEKEELVKVKIQECVDISGIPTWVPTLYLSLAEAREANPRTPPNFFRRREL